MFTLDEITRFLLRKYFEKFIRDGDFSVSLLLTFSLPSFTQKKGDSSRKT